MTPHPPASPSPLSTTEPDVALLLQALQDAWNAADTDAMFAAATLDVHWVNVVGMHWQGLQDVKRAHAAFFDQMFRGVPLTLQAVEHVKALPGGARLIVARWLLGPYRTPPGDQRPASLNRMSVLAVPGPGGLQVSHVANIEVDPRAAPHDPVLR